MIPTSAAGPGAPGDPRDPNLAWETLAAQLSSGRGSIGARAPRLKEVLATCAGPRPPDLPSLPPPPPAPPLRPMRVAHRARLALLDAAQEVLDGLLAKEPERLEPHLSERVTVLWADGSLAVHPRGPLIEALEAAPGEAAPVILRDVRAYLPGELRSVRPRGELEALAAACEAPSVAVTAALDSRRGRRGRAMVWASLEGPDRWRIHTLALPSPDDVVVESKRASAAEDEAVRVADRVVRHWLLGHASQLKAMRNHMMANVWLAQTLGTAEALIQAREQRTLDADATWQVFLGTQLARPAHPKDWLGVEAARDLERKAKEAWKRPWSRLRPKWTETTVAIWDPDARAATRTTKVRCLLLAQDDVDAREEVSERWRLAALFDPAP